MKFCSVPLLLSSIPLRQCGGFHFSFFPPLFDILLNSKSEPLQEVCPPLPARPRLFLYRKDLNFFTLETAPSLSKNGKSSPFLFFFFFSDSFFSPSRHPLSLVREVLFSPCVLPPLDVLLGRHSDTLAFFFLVLLKRFLFLPLRLLFLLLMIGSFFSPKSSPLRPDVTPPIAFV